MPTDYIPPRYCPKRARLQRQWCDHLRAAGMSLSRINEIARRKAWKGQEVPQ